MLIAELLLQRSRGGTVARVYGELFSRWPNAQDLAGADLTQIEEVIRPLGLIRRASAIKAIALQVVEGGGVPSSVELMLQLKGIGRYAASATASAALGIRSATVDGTSARVYRRFFGLQASKDSRVDEELWVLAEAVTPTRAYREWNWAVLDLAAVVCLPKHPRCPSCPLAKDCVVGSQRIQDLVGGID